MLMGSGGILVWDIYIFMGSRNKHKFNKSDSEKNIVMYKRVYF